MGSNGCNNAGLRKTLDMSTGQLKELQHSLKSKEQCKGISTETSWLE